MSMGRAERRRQKRLFISGDQVPESPGHPFYERLNQVLSKHDFDQFAEEACRSFYAEKKGRPSVPPGVYFRLLLIGYFEGIDSERGIAWRVADSLALRGFLGYELDQRTPEHSTLSRIRQRIDLETHDKVLKWVLKVLSQEKLLRGKTIGVDTTTLEANAALRSIVRRDTGASYEEYLTELAKASGIETPTRQDLARLDKKRKKKGSNDDWTHPHDPDSSITKMKDGRTHLAHKAVHAVDMDTGAVVHVGLVDATQGDTETLPEAIVETQDKLEESLPETKPEQLLNEFVGDKGFHSNDNLEMLSEDGVRSYVSEPDRGRRNWDGKPEAKKATYANRRRIRGDRGKRLLAKRGEVLERSNAHLYETGGMRRVHLRGRQNILKRLLVHTSAFNLGLLMRKLVGAGTPRGLRALARAANALLSALRSVLGWLMPVGPSPRAARPMESLYLSFKNPRSYAPQQGPLSTGC